MHETIRVSLRLMRSARFVLCALIFIVLNVPAQADSQARLTVCNSCFSEYSFKSAAEQSSFNYHPAMEGLDSVYVLNPSTEEIQYFDVRRWYEVGDLQPRSIPNKEGQIRGASYGYYRADAVPAAGDPAVQAAIMDGVTVAKSFAQDTLGSVGIGEVDPGSNINSAIDLVGPSDSAVGLNRNALRNLLNNYYNAGWAEQVFTLSDLGQRFVDKILAQSVLLNGAVITVTFTDGTMIQVSFESILEGLDGGPLFMDLDVIEETARGPGLPAVPLSGGEFENFSYTGSPLRFRG